VSRPWLSGSERSSNTTSAPSPASCMPANRRSACARSAAHDADRSWFPDGRQAVAIDLAAHSMPVQLIWGRDDHIIPAAHAEALAGRLPVHILDAAGHLPHMEKAGEVNRLIARFIAAS